MMWPQNSIRNQATKQNIFSKAPFERPPFSSKPKWRNAKNKTTTLHGAACGKHHQLITLILEVAAQKPPTWCLSPISVRTAPATAVWAAPAFFVRSIAVPPPQPPSFRGLPGLREYESAMATPPVEWLQMRTNVGNQSCLLGPPVERME